MLKFIHCSHSFRGSLEALGNGLRFGNLVRFWIDAVAGRKVEELESSVADKFCLCLVSIFLASER